MAASMQRNLKMEYKNLGNSGLKVSKIILGGMSYGSLKWQDWVLEEDKALPLLKHAYDQGINTWDTADTYSNGVSEEIFGKALKKYDIPRENVVIMSKCFCGVSNDGAQSVFEMNNSGLWVNRVGLSRKHIFDAVEASVKRLGTYIDVFQIHRLDQGTPKEEIMRALNDVVNSGMVRYIGASSMAAWEFQQLQSIAEKHNWHKFISMQNFHNLLYREEEREMIPYCNFTGVGLIPWSPIARGVLARPFKDSGATLRGSSDFGITYLVKPGEKGPDEAICDRVEELAKKKGVSMAMVATAWSISKGCAPILGLNSEKRIDEACEALKVELSEEEIKYLEKPYLAKPVTGF